MLDHWRHRATQAICQRPKQLVFILMNDAVGTNDINAGLQNRTTPEIGDFPQMLQCAGYRFKAGLFRREQGLVGKLEGFWPVLADGSHAPAPRVPSADPAHTL